MSDGYLFHSEERLLDVASDAIAHARQCGADAASALVNAFGGATIRVRNELADVAVGDGGHSLSITVFDGDKRGTATTEALDKASMERTVEQALVMARMLAPSPDDALADPDWLAMESEEVALFAPSGLEPQALKAAALDIEAAANERAAEAGVPVSVDQAAASSRDMRWARVTSQGFARAASASIQSRACVAIARNDEGMARDWWQNADRQQHCLADAGLIARQAVDKTAAKLGGRAVPTQTAPVLLDARIAASLVSDLVSGLSGGAQHQRATFLVDSIGEQRLAEHLDLVENPFEPFGLASSAWDSDGIAGCRRHIVKGGVVEGYFLNARFARKLGMVPTGNADGPGNLTFTSSLTGPEDDLPAMLRRMHRGLWVTEFTGGAVNPTTGGFSKAVQGFWIEDGAVVHPVQDVTIAGQLPDMLRSIVMIGADQYRQGAIRSGSILLPAMRIASR